MYLVDRLRETQHDSENPRLFEETMTEAFQQLGAQAVHKGGTNEPDVLLDISGQKIVIDTKTTKEKSISEGYINFDALERYKEAYGGDLVAVVAVGFSRGNVRDTAEKRSVVLIETEAVCKTLENHMFYPYKPQQIYEMMFGSDKAVITPEDIEPSTKNVKGEIKILEQVLSGLKRLHYVNIDSLHVICRYVGLDIGKEEVEEALTFLSSPPFDIVNKEEDAYSFAIDFDEILKRLGILYTALQFPEQKAESKDLRSSVHKPEGKRIPRFLEHVLEVVKLMDEGNLRKEALRKRANQSKVTYNTVFAACTRNLGLKNIKEFDELAYKKNRDKLISFLGERFPNYKNLISNTLFTHKITS